jgi:acyl-CoA synthetase (AMP-forming)/AMP-acid ligase II
MRSPMELVPFQHWIRARAEDDHPALRFEDRSWSYREWVASCAQRAAFLLATRRPGPLHVGVLLDNVPEYPLWIGAAALAGGVVVGINPTRRGVELARDVRHTDCQRIVTESAHRALVDGLELGLSAEHVLDVDSEGYAKALEPFVGAPLPEVEAGMGDTLLLLFTSGTSGAPKAVICSQGKLSIVSQSIVATCGLDRETVSYQAMPMFHSNALFAGLGPTIVAGGTSVLRRRFSASGMLPDVRKYGCSYFNYVGKPLSYILAQPERDDDADNPLRVAFGNEAADLDIERFARRFGVRVIDNYGSTETGASVIRLPDQPKGALGRADPATRVLDPETGKECAIAVFDEHGRLTNAEEAIGELVNTGGKAFFEGYYKNESADRARMRDGMYWTGDLAYRDADGFLYFAGRDYDWLRVDGENFAAAPVERILARYPGVVLAAVYAVPDEEVGDQVMAALQVASPERFDPADFDAFLARQSDLGTKASPRYVRTSTELPVTQTSKVVKRALRAERWECDEPVWFRPTKGEPLRRMKPEDAAALRRVFSERGREGELR